MCMCVFTELNNIKHETILYFLNSLDINWIRIYSIEFNSVQPKNKHNIDSLNVCAVNHIWNEYVFL